MRKTNIRVKIEIIKTDSGEIIVKNKKKMNKLLDDLSAGQYKLIVEKEDAKLTSMKKFYFVMESKLSTYLGYTKDELHSALKPIFLKETIDGVTYDSISEIKNEEDMMSRIIQLQKFAAEEFDYVTEPYSE